MIRKEFLFFLLLFGALFFLALNRHSKSGRFSYQSELWADKAGYSIYLPATCIYNWDAKALPKDIVKNTGFGFEIDSVRNTIKTKYPYGIAILQLPFWCIAHAIATDKSGFSMPYHYAIDAAAALYCTLGFYFLYLICNYRQFKKQYIIIGSAFVLLATNALFYVIYESGMSHIYSFALFAALLFVVEKQKHLLWLVFISLLIFIVRPINIVFLLPIYLFYFSTIKNIVASHFTFKNSIASILLIIIFVIPIILYNAYVGNPLLMLSYPNEGFTNIASPKIAEVAFAPKNGLFLYSPILVVAGILFGIQSRIAKLWWTCLILYIVLYASWWSYYLGCAFGHRGIIDILPIFTIALIEFLNRTKQKLILVVFSLCLAWTFLLTFSSDVCFYGTHDWDWPAFQKLLLKRL
jgi:hypothetical protein